MFGPDMAQHPLDDFIEKSKIFSLLDEEGRERLARIANSVRFAAGETIITEGAEGDAFFALTAGEVSVEAKDFGNQDTHLAELQAGDVFGEIAALTGEPRTATIRAKTAVEVLRFEMVSVFNVLKDYPEVLAELNRLGVDRSEDLIEKT